MSDDGYQYVTTLDLDFINGLLDPRAQWRLARLDVELPAVPGAGHTGSLKGSLGERTTLVRANSVDG